MNAFNTLKNEIKELKENKAVLLSSAKGLNNVEVTRSQYDYLMAEVDALNNIIRIKMEQLVKLA